MRCVNEHQESTLCFGQQKRTSSSSVQQFWNETIFFECTLLVPLSPSLPNQNSSGSIHRIVKSKEWNCFSFFTSLQINFLCQTLFNIIFNPLVLYQVTLWTLNQFHSDKVWFWITIIIISFRENSFTILQMKTWSNSLVNSANRINGIHSFEEAKRLKKETLGSSKRKKEQTLQNINERVFLVK